MEALTLIFVNYFTKVYVMLCVRHIDFHNITKSQELSLTPHIFHCRYETRSIFLGNIREKHSWT